MSQRLAIIGFGSIAQSLVGILCDAGVTGEVAVLVRDGRQDTVGAGLADIIGTRALQPRVVTQLDALLEPRPDVVVECAGHGAVAQYGADILIRGVDLIIASVGALAEAALMARLRDSAQMGGAQITLPAGAIGGIDALAAARLSGLKTVTYVGRKPPLAWAGTPAEQAVDLAALTRETVFFEGSARAAATQYPKNANVAATLALAGMGMDETRVRLIADPAAAANTHEFEVTSGAVDFSMTLAGKPSPLNPKTSQSTVYSIARAVLNRSDAIVI